METKKRRAKYHRFKPKAKATYQCKICDKTFSQAVYLKTHVRNHTGEKRYHCNDCEDTFEEYRLLINHKKMHHSLTCELCGKSLHSQSHLAEHLKTHTGEKLECSQCKRLFASFQLLRMHLRSHAEETIAEDSYQINEYETDSPVALDSLLGPIVEERPKDFKISAKPPDSSTGKYELPSTDIDAGPNNAVIRQLQCTYCNKIFSRSSNLTKHLNIHTKERSFKCLHCEKTFLHSFALTRHLRVHTGEKPYKCSHCNRHFSDPSTRNRHSKRHAQKLKGVISFRPKDHSTNDPLESSPQSNGDVGNVKRSPVQKVSSFDKQTAGLESPSGNHCNEDDDDMQPVLEILSANQSQSFVLNSGNSKQFDLMNDL